MRHIRLGSWPVLTLFLLLSVAPSAWGATDHERLRHGARNRSQGKAAGVSNAPRGETISVLGARREGLVPKASSAATKTDTPLIDTPDSISVITRAQMDQLNARTITEALHYTAGASGDAASGYTTRFDEVEVRGFQGAAGADEFLDGLRLFNGAAYATEQIDPYLLDRYDLLKGPPSVVYGQSSPGGAIVLTTKHPGVDPVHMVSVEGGTYGYVRGTGDIGGRLDRDGHWLYRVAATATTSGTQDLHTRNERFAVLPSLTWRPNDKLEATVSALWQRDPRGGNFATAPAVGTILPNPYGQISRHFYPGDQDFETYKRTQAFIDYQLAYHFTPDWTLRSVGRYANVGATFRQVSAAGGLDSDDRTLERVTYGSEEHFDTVSLEEQLVGHIRTGALRHAILIGGNWQNIRDSSNLYVGTAPSLDVYAPVYNQAIPPLTSADLSSIQSVSTNQEAIFGQDEMSWGNLHGQLGIRHDWSAIDTRSVVGGTSFDQPNQATTWRGGLLYAIDKVISPYFNYAQSFQPTNSLSYNGTPFIPTRGRQYEAGLKYQPTAFNGFFTLAFYNLKQSHALVPDPVPSHAGFSVQTGGIRSRGVEFEAHIDLWRDFNLIAAYTYQDVTYTGASGSLTGQRVAAVPKQQFSLWGHYNIPAGALRGLGFGLGVRYNGNTLADNTYGYLASGYTVLDAQAQYSLGSLMPRLKGVLLQVTAQNLTNKLYYPGCLSVSSGCYIGANRNVIGKVTYNW
ncbi:TonB-dependent siderophore receptor [Acidomonas methanolica]|uniref:TonB-dependent siderophore receptor n=1 Tax=Acidomonas methanolica TaxID=437 RepID=UPI00211A8ECB|nr:TonB-dependent siderophore receptor [Acidomonas methanolica]MCQ9154478.1 TonB-dependent siderophore receptor [Acidomonas methanolica]